MKMKKYKKIKTVKTVAEEPKTEYSSGSLQKFGSFEEMNDADLLEMASFSPLERMSHITQLLKQFYAQELKSKFSDFTIHFK